MGWVKLVLGVGVAAYSYRSVTHVNSLVRQIAVPKYSLLAKHTQAGMRTDRQALNNIHKCPPFNWAFLQRPNVPVSINTIDHVQFYFQFEEPVVVVSTQQ